jgi:hypothetical protein
MKGVPTRSISFDPTDAIAAAAELTAATSRAVIDKSKLPMKVIAVRINEADYNHLNSLFAAQGTSLAAAGKAAIFRLADAIEAGRLEIPNGVIREVRK